MIIPEFEIVKTPLNECRIRGPVQVFQPDITLHDHEIHVWHARLESHSAELKFIKSILSSDELLRAERFYFEQDRVNYCVSRGLLRTIIAHYIGMAPNLLSFKYGAYGKPYLDNNVAGAELHFNVSHSGGNALFAFSAKHPIGVDLERISIEIDYEAMAKQILTTREIDFLGSITENKRLETFYRIWTCKEAYTKLVGVGLNMPLGNIDVTSFRGTGFDLLDRYNDRNDLSDCTIRSLNTWPEFAAAITVESEDIGVS